MILVTVGFAAAIVGLTFFTMLHSRDGLEQQMAKGQHETGDRSLAAQKEREEEWLPRAGRWRRMEETLRRSEWKTRSLERSFEKFQRVETPDAAEHDENESVSGAPDYLRVVEDGQIVERVVYYATDREPTEETPWLAIIWPGLAAVGAAIIYASFARKLFSPVVRVGFVCSFVLMIPMAVWFSWFRWTVFSGEEAKLAVRYGSAQAGELSYGHCRVSVPKKRAVGDHRRPRFTEDSGVDRSRHWVLLDTQSFEGPRPFFEAVKKASHAHQERLTLVFIHGYLTSFSDAVRNAAQIAHDIEILGDLSDPRGIVPVLYSWASRGTLDGYPADREAARQTRFLLSDFLEELGRTTPGSRTYLVAHSMGCFALLRGLVQGGGLGDQVAGIVMAAPDIYSSEFGQEVDKLVTSAARVTLYCSHEDRALEASRRFHQGQERVGLIKRGGKPFVAPGVETVDATAVAGDVLGHSYYARDKRVIRDIALLICRGWPAAGREQLEGRPSTSKPRWWELLAR